MSGKVGYSGILKKTSKSPTISLIEYLPLAYNCVRAFTTAKLFYYEIILFYSSMLLYAQQL